MRSHLAPKILAQSLLKMPRKPFSRQTRILCTTKKKYDHGGKVEEEKSSIPSPSLSPSPTATYSCNYERTSHLFQPRYAGPDPRRLTVEQTSIRENILRTRPRTGLEGPFGPWLSAPSIASPAEQLGRACRYGTSLSFRESEWIILLTGARHGSHAEFDIHYEEAKRAGIDERVLQCIPRDEEFSASAVEERVLHSPLFLIPENENDNDDGKKRKNREVEIIKFTTELLETSTVVDETYERAKDVLGGHEVLVEITSIVGYYTYAAYTLNVFRIPTKPISS